MKKVVFLGLTFVLTSFVSTVVSAGSLENLERERSVAIATMLDSTIDVDARWNKLNISKRRLLIYIIVHIIFRNPFFHFR